MFTTGVLLTLLFASPAAAPREPAPIVADSAGTGDVVEVQKTEEELGDMGFMERRAAFSLNDDLHPSIEDDLLPFFLGGVCSYFGGPLWLPLLFLDEQPNDYFDEGFLSYLVWAIPLWAGGVITVIPYIGWLFGLVYCPAALIISFYLMPVNVANAWDRAAKVYGMKEGKKRKKRSSAVLPPEDNALALIDPAMAY